MNDRSIAVVELFGHSEVLYNYNRILRTAGYKVNNYTAVEIRDDAPAELKHGKDMDWICKPANQSVPEFIETVSAELENNALILFITIAEPLSFFSRLRFDTPSVLVVHDYLAFFEGAPHFMLAKDSAKNFLKDLLKVGRYFLRRELTLTQRTVANFSAWAVPSDAVFQYVKQKKGPLDSSQIGSLDFALFEEFIPPQQNLPHLSIVVPGIVSDKSRDYHLLLNAFRKIAQTLSVKVRLTLLGTLRRQYGEEINTGFQQISKKQLEVITFNRYIQQEEFDQTLREANFLLLPIKRTMKYSIFGELNGLTCVSGNVNDILRFGIPAILPSFYPIDPRIEPMISAYSNEGELIALLQDWIHNQSYIQKRLKGKTCCIPFSKEALAQKFKNMIEPLIK